MTNGLDTKELSSGISMYQFLHSLIKCQEKQTAGIVHCFNILCWLNLKFVKGLFDLSLKENMHEGSLLTSMVP